MRVHNDRQYLVGVGDVDSESVAEIKKFSGREDRPFVTNVSRTDNYLNCPMQYYWRYKANLVPSMGGPNIKPYLVQGTAFHKIIEIYVTTGDMDAAVQAAVEYVQEFIELSDSFATITTLEKAVQWLQDVGPVIALRFGPTLGLKKVVAAEQALWLYHKETHTLLVGRPDIIGVDENGKVVHVQVKTRTKSLPDVEAFATRLSFTGHEAVYGKAIHLATQGGLLPGLDKSMPYGGGQLLIAFKIAKPETPDLTPQKVILAAMEKGKVLEYTPEHIVLDEDECTAKQAQTYQDMWQKYRSRVVSGRSEIEAWPAKVLRMIHLDLDKNKMERLVDSFMLVTERQREDEQRTPERVPKNTGACESYGWLCPYIEGYTCGGFDKFSTDEGWLWTRREPDYVDETKKTLEESWRS